MTMVNNFTVMVPQADNEGKAYDMAVIEAVIAKLTKLCGGYTATMHEGAWYSEREERVMTDTVKAYQFYYKITEPMKRNELLYLINQLVSAIVVYAGQEAVSVKFGDVLEFFADDLDTITYAHTIKKYFKMG